MYCPKNWHKWGLYSALFVAGVMLLCLRNPDPIVNPVVYAEDGTWTALGLREGWINAFVFSRTDYFVFLNTILLFISSVIALVAGGGSIEYLPYAIALISYSFYSAFALLVFLTINRVSSVFFAAYGFLLVLILPLGSTENEIIGRILQIGFFMPALAMMLFFWRDRCGGVFVRRAIDLTIVVSAGTNPVVFVLAFIYFPYILFLSNLNFVGTLKKNALLISLLSPLAIAILSRLGGQGGVPGDFVAGNFIEAAVARSILFPLIFPWYGKLSNALSLSILLAFVLIVFVAITVSSNLEAKKLTYAVIATAVVYTFLTILMRPGLTGLLNQYQTSFPDRYFMGVNVLASILIVLALVQLVDGFKTKVFGVIVGVSVSLVYLYGRSEIFEFNESRMPIRAGLSFKDQICLSEKLHGLYKVQIYPELSRWSMLIPEKYIKKADCTFRSYEELGIARPGDEDKMIATPPLEKEKAINLNIFDGARGKPISKIEIVAPSQPRGASASE